MDMPVLWLDHPHTMRMGDMVRCTVCHRSWQTDEAEKDIPRCEPVVEDTPQVRYDRFRARTNKEKGWDGPRRTNGQGARTRSPLRR